MASLTQIKEISISDNQAFRKAIELNFFTFVIVTY